ncbi:MAG TPA: ribonuclease P protein component [Planctomycetota bacterium]|nr:ribonuclease P protein component [Planctomycetota bacterium]
MDQRHPPEARLHDQRDFSRVFQRQRKAAGKHVVVLAVRRARRAGTRARLGVVVSTKVSSRAVRRHQLKRWVRELFRTRLSREATGFDLVVLFRRDPPPDGHAALDREIIALVPKALAAAAGGGQAEPSASAQPPGPTAAP